MTIKYRQAGEVVEVEGQLFSGILDMHGKEIWEGDTLRFTNKWEWWRGQFGGGFLATNADYQEVLHDHVKYPYEERVIELPADYDWLLSKEVQTYWEVVNDEAGTD